MFFLLKRKKCVTKKWGRFINLIKEVSPPDAVIYISMDGSNYSAKEMIEKINLGNEIGLDYISDVLRVSRDFIKAYASKGKKI